MLGYYGAWSWKCCLKSWKSIGQHAHEPWCIHSRVVFHRLVNQSCGTRISRCRPDGMPALRSPFFIQLQVIGALTASSRPAPLPTLPKPWNVSTSLPFFFYLPPPLPVRTANIDLPLHQNWTRLNISGVSSASYLFFSRLKRMMSWVTWNGAIVRGSFLWTQKPAIVCLSSTERCLWRWLIVAAVSIIWAFM